MEDFVPNIENKNDFKIFKFNYYSHTFKSEVLTIERLIIIESPSSKI